MALINQIFTIKSPGGPLGDPLRTVKRDKESGAKIEPTILAKNPGSPVSIEVGWKTRKQKSGVSAVAGCFDGGGGTKTKLANQQKIKEEEKWRCQCRKSDKTRLGMRAEGSLIMQVGPERGWAKRHTCDKCSAYYMRKKNGPKSHFTDCPRSNLRDSNSF